MTPQLIAAFISAVVASGILVGSAWWQRRQERRAVLLVYASELVLAFSRIATYYVQRSGKTISYSDVYQFTDSNTLTRIVNLVADPAVIYAIVRLKEKYFQIGRYVRLASTMAAEWRVLDNTSQEYVRRYGVEDARTKDIRDRAQEAHSRAIHAQGTALAFFEFEMMFEWTKTFLEYVKRNVTGRQIDELQTRLYQAQRDKLAAELRLRQ